MSKLISTFFYIGYLRPAPGTWGSLTALIISFGIIQYSSILLLIIAILFGFFIGWIAVAKQTLNKRIHDPSEIVIDEVVGQWIAVLPLALLPLNSGSSYTLWFMALIIFRVLDITKPGLIGWADRKNTPLSVMLDDLIAGAMTAAIIYLTFILLKWI